MLKGCGSLLLLRYFLFGYFFGSIVSVLFSAFESGFIKGQRDNGVGQDLGIQ